MIEKLSTGINGFDQISQGGLPKEATTLLTGTSGSAKTVFAVQYLGEGINQFDQPGVFVTFEEPPNKIRNHAEGLGIPIKRWEEEGKWAFVDASPTVDEEIEIVGRYDMGALLARIESNVSRIGATRLVVDSIGAIFSRFGEAQTVRHELYRIATSLNDMGVTSLITAERTEEYGEIARHGVEEFVADNVVILRNVLDEEKRRRTIEILKFRGTTHHKGEWPFTVIPGQGIIIIPLSAIELKQKSSDARISSGNDEMDQMCGGGFFRDSVILASGATGCGKTLMVTEFVGAPTLNGERSLLFAYEESREQLFRNATGWGFDFVEQEKEGRLRVECAYPESAGLEDHLIRMKEVIAEYKPDRVAIDSLSALERVSNLKGFREFIIGLTSFIKQQEIAGLFTATTTTLMGGPSITEGHFSTITDSIILLRYVELFGEMRRGITVLKMRGSFHDKDIREFNIDGEGMHIGKPFRNVTGIMSGHLVHVAPNEAQSYRDMFDEEVSPDA